MATASPKSRLDLLHGKYVLGDCIGAGGMGRVYRAHQPALERVVAIKVMHPTLAENPHVVRHFRTEALAAAGIAHPNSVAVLDYGETEDGIPFLVMELVEGRSLAQLVRDEAPLDPARAIAIVVQVLGALEEAHLAGVIHADVKSDNVLVQTRRDGSDHVKLVDFGLARIAREPIFFDDVDVISGTPEYMAPEIIAGAPPSRASDIYAAGALLYELLTASTPFAGGTHDEVMERHAHDVLVPPSLRVPELAIPAHVDGALVTALAKDPAKRFSSAEGFANALTAVATERGRARLQRPTRPAVDDIDTLVLPHAVARRDHSAGQSTSESELRHHIGGAIVRGSVNDIVTGYLALAALLRSRDQPNAAIHELEEALDILPGPAPAILTALIPLYLEIGDHRAATLARRALDDRETLTMRHP